MNVNRFVVLGGISGYSGRVGLSGYSGASGTSGFSGTSGIGTSGFSGASGTSGLSGYSGTSGLSGFSGTSGASGVGGQSGVSGYSGISGFSGLTPGNGLRISNTIFTAPVDASGNNNTLAIGTGLRVNLNIPSSQTPLVISFSNGFDATGNPASDIAVVTASVSLASVNASSTNYIYVNRNTTTGALTYGATTVIPEYRNTYNATPTTNMLNYINHERKMYLYNGSWASGEYVVLGCAYAGSATLNAVVNYPIGKDWTGIFSQDRVNLLGTVTANFNINLALGNKHIVTINGTGLTMTLTNPQEGRRYIIEIIQASGGSKTITTYTAYNAQGAAASFLWRGGTAPTLTTTAAKKDIIAFEYSNGIYSADCSLNF